MSSEKKSEYLFVYGTLRDETNHPMADLLQKYTHDEHSAAFQGKLFDTGDFPAAIPSDDVSDLVHGKLCTVTDSRPLFYHLDPYEGYDPHNPSNSLFIRKKIPVNKSTVSTVDSWVYIYNKPTEKLTPIPDGDYLNYLKNQEQ